MRKALVLAAACGVFGIVIGRWTAPMPAAADAPIANGDVNADGKLDVSDGIYIINYVFRGGPVPVALECPPTGLPATGQTKCYDDSPQLVPCSSESFPGQDGFYQAGCPTGGRFVDNDDGTVTDNCTGLMWQKDTADVNGDGQRNSLDRSTWWDALRYCESLSFADHDDWRLPNVRELQSIYDYGRTDAAIDPVFTMPFMGEDSYIFWSSTTSPRNIPGAAWFVSFGAGSSVEFKEMILPVRAVRGGL